MEHRAPAAGGEIVRIVRRLTADCRPPTLFAHLDDLGAYPAWMSLVHDVERLDGTSAASSGADAVASERPAWDVELRARVGPFARSKRLRMERTEHVENERVVFARCEADDRVHSPWVLHADLRPIDSADGADRTELTMTLEYGGGLWTGAVLQQVLDQQVTAGSEALRRLVSGEPTH